ncbi:hypothetical protein CSB45_02155 [candidate division KSB3 bacterium]|uniref:Uncharacterized protein n=1 Tax=candidate division KSB3 bacterium TaxID=2044937 RepID=A0A2G6E9T3_9BACT|nr:MAG: hypothetical protein CSB45_02155 [candidate division KSB3 bacterium]PIE30885.1 MAG: hypothetical protein CSA57_00765 [candidate division KSB3 bacterium]
MNGLFYLIVVYLIFSSFGSVVKKLQQQTSSQQPAHKSSEPQLDTAREDAHLPEAALKLELDESVIYQAQDSADPHLCEGTLDPEDDEIAFHAQDVSVEAIPELVPQPPAGSAKKRPHALSWLPLDGPNSLKGIVLAEILGPPVSRRSHSTRN